MARHIEVSAANMRAIHKARADHDARCSGAAAEVHLAPFDVERMGWEDGDIVVGLRVVGNPDVQPMVLRIVCDLDLAEGEREVETVDAVASTPVAVPS